MKLDSTLKLRKVGSHHMVVRYDMAKADMTEVYTLNDTAAMLWSRAEGIDFTPEMMAGWLCEEYDVDPQTALEDVESMIGDWKAFGLIK